MNSQTPFRQVPVLREALALGAPEMLDEIGDRLGLIVNCLNASGYRIAPDKANEERRAHPATRRITDSEGKEARRSKN